MTSIRRKVAIGMPVFNGEKYLRKSLDSLLNQTFLDFDLFISDNASTDATEEICKEYAAKDSKIKYIRQDKNIGIAKNFDFVKCIASDYDFFMWAAHDDFWDANWLMELFQNVSEDDLAIRGKALNVDENDHFIAETKVSDFKKGEVGRVFLDNEKNGKAFYYYALFNNKKLKQVQFDLLNLDKTYGADVLFICHMVQFGALRTIKTTAQYYRRHSTSTTKYYSKQWFGLKRLAFYLFPVSTYFYVLKVTDKKYWPTLIAVIPLKFIKSQIDIWPRIIRLAFTGRTI